MVNDTTTLNGALAELGETMAANLTQQGVTSSASEGLTTLAGKILDIQTGGGSCYHIEFSEDSYTAVGGSATLEIMLQENYAPKSGATVTVTGSDSSLYTGITNSSGIVSVTVSNISAETTFTATYSNVSDTCTVTTHTIIFDDSTEYSETVTPSGDTRTNIITSFNFDASVDFEMTCDLYFSAGNSMFGLFPVSPNNTYQYYIAFGGNPDKACLYWGTSSGGEDSIKINGAQIIGQYYSLKFVKVGYQVTTYINGTLFSSTTPTTTLGDHGNMCFAFGFWGSGSRTGKVKNLKIVEI